MKSDISEFSYGFALVNELADSVGSGLRAAPLFPSLRQEARLGYDVKLDRPGLPLFLQFKLSDCMVSNRAKEIQKGIFPRGTNNITPIINAKNEKKKLFHSPLVNMNGIM